MPRKPKVPEQQKQTITVVVNGKPISIILHPRPALGRAGTPSGTAW